MTVVIDVGAARYGGDYSMERLIAQFEPTWLYAIDPNPALTYPDPQELAKLFDDLTSDFGQTQIQLVHAAAWIFDGEMGYRSDGLNSWMTEDPHAPKVECIDLATFITEVANRHDDRLVLKLDCEGSEYYLLPHIHEREADELLDLVIVEWHPASVGDEAQSLREDAERWLTCEVQEWPY